MQLDWNYNSKNHDLKSFQVHGGLTHLWLKREDLLGDGISGNKLRKLKYNVLEAIKEGYTQILTFGGGYSNHILAASFIKKNYGIDVIGVVRGEELIDKIDDKDVN